MTYLIGAILTATVLLLCYWTIHIRDSELCEDIHPLIALFILAASMMWFIFIPLFAISSFLIVFFTKIVRWLS